MNSNNRLNKVSVMLIRHVDNVHFPGMAVSVYTALVPFLWNRKNCWAENWIAAVVWFKQYHCAHTKIALWSL